MRTVHIVTNAQEARDLAEHHGRNYIAAGLNPKLLTHPHGSITKLDVDGDEFWYVPHYNIDNLLGIEYDAYSISDTAMPLMSHDEINTIKSRARMLANQGPEDISPLKKEIRIPTTYPGIPAEKFYRFPLPSKFEPLSQEYSMMTSALYEFNRVEIKVELVYRLVGVER